MHRAYNQALCITNECLTNILFLKIIFEFALQPGFDDLAMSDNPKFTKQKESNMHSQDTKNSKKKHNCLIFVLLACSATIS